MKYVFDKNGIVNSENTERLVQYSVNANELQVAFTDLNIKEYVPYVAFERADGKVSPLIGMAFTDFELSGTKYSGASYSFSDSWVTAQSGILKVAVILKKNNVNARTSTFNLNVAESISEDKVNYIDDVAYNELVGRVYQLEKKQQDIINGDLSVGVADKAHSDYFGHEFTEHYETKIGATEKVNELKRKVENGEVIGYGAHRDGVGNNIVATYETKEQSNAKVNALAYDMMARYYTKSETYTQEEIRNLIAGVSTLDIQTVSILPVENISTTTIYLLETNGIDETNIYEEYIYVNNKWELIGTTKVDLSQYVTNEIFNSVSQALWQKTLANETALENAKLSFVNKNYTKINYEGKILKRNYSPTTISKGKWIFRDNNNTINYTAGSMTANFIDTFGNVFYNLEFMGSTISAYNGVIYTKILDTVNKTGLAYKDGVINEEYAIEFLDEINASEIIRLINDEIYVAYKYDYIDVYETLKNNYYDKKKVNELINDLSTLSLKVVNELPTENISTKTIYLKRKESSPEDNSYDEYLYIEDHWELIGNTKFDVDLDIYALKDELPDKWSLNPTELRGWWHFNNLAKLNDKTPAIKEKLHFIDNKGNTFRGIAIYHAKNVNTQEYVYSSIYCSFDEDFTNGLYIYSGSTNTGLATTSDYYLMFPTGNENKNVLNVLKQLAIRFEENRLSDASLKIYATQDYVVKELEDKLGNIESILDTLNGEVA